MSDAIGLVYDPTYPPVSLQFTLSGRKEQSVGILDFTKPNGIGLGGGYTYSSTLNIPSVPVGFPSG
jgi:hypothetical protein